MAMYTREVEGEKVFYAGYSPLAKSLTLEKTLYLFYLKGPHIADKKMVLLDRYGQE